MRYDKQPPEVVNKVFMFVLFFFCQIEVLLSKRGAAFHETSPYLYDISSAGCLPLVTTLDVVRVVGRCGKKGVCDEGA